MGQESYAGSTMLLKGAMPTSHMANQHHSVEKIGGGETNSRSVSAYCSPGWDRSKSRWCCSGTAVCKP